MGCLWRLLKLTIILFVLTWVLRSFGAEWAVSFYLQKSLGTQVDIGGSRVDLVNTQACFENVVIHNPIQFPEGRLFVIPSLVVDFDFNALFRGKVRMKYVEANILETKVLKDAAGLNLYKLKVFSPEAKDRVDFFVGRFVMSLDKGSYQDLTVENSEPLQFELGLGHAEFNDVQGLRQMFSLIAASVEKRMGVKAALHLVE